MFSLYLTIVLLLISRFGFEDWIWFLIASVPDLCILFTFFKHLNIVSVFHLDLQTIEGINFGLVRMFRFSWIIFTLELVLSYADKLLVFRMGTNWAPLVADLLYFTMKEIS